MLSKSFCLFITVALVALAAQAAPNRASDVHTSVAPSTTAKAKVDAVAVNVAKVKGKGKGKGQGNGGGNNSLSASGTGAVRAASTTIAASASTTVAASDSATASAASASTTVAASASATTSAAAASSTDLQSSLTLDQSQIQTGFEQDGQEVPEAGQEKSLTSSNNFINFCAGKTITNGKQIQAGSCNPAIMGEIVAQTLMPSCKFTFPQNFGTVQANTAFTISMAINNLETGNFVNAQQNYFAAPQQLGSSGQITGHSHVVVEALDSITQTTPTDPTKFAFFKGLNAPAAGGILTADVTNGLPAGAYRLFSITTAANHQPVLLPVAQHGSPEDGVYFTVTDGGNAAANAAANSTVNAASAAGAAASSSSSASSAAATQNGKAKKKNGNNRRSSTFDW